MALKAKPTTGVPYATPPPAARVRVGPGGARETRTMKAGIFLNGSGAILVLTSHDSLEDKDFVRKLRDKGVEKYIAFEVSPDLVHKHYGGRFRSVMEDLKQEDDLRVMDFDGQRIFQRFSFDEMGEPSFHEPEAG
jgi:hypothetical protein